MSGHAPSRSQPGRRHLPLAAVIAGTAGWLAHGAAIATGEPYGALGLVGLLALAVGWIAGRALIGDIAERRVSEVDEYELEQRQSARSAGYVCALGALITLFIVLTVAVQLEERGRQDLLLQAPQLAFAAFLLVAAGPTLLLTWQLRRRPRDDEGVSEE